MLAWRGEEEGGREGGTILAWRGGEEGRDCTSLEK
jgi:hypothetical protein